MSGQAPTKTGSSKAALGVIFLTVFLDLLGFGIILPLLTFYALDFDASPLQVTLLMSVFSLAQLVFTPIWGRLSDRYGRRSMLLVSIALNLISYLVFAGAPNLAVLFAARIGSGIAASNIGVAQAFIADTTTPENRSKGMGMIGAAFGLGFVIGPAMGGLLAQLGDRAMPLAAATLAAVNLVSAFFFLPESLSVEARQAARQRPWLGGFRLPAWTRRPALVGLMSLLLLVYACFSVMEATLALFFEDRLGYGVRETSWFFFFIGLVMVVVQGALLNPLVRTFGERRLIAGGIVLMALGLGLVPTSEIHLALVLTSGGILAVAAGIFNPSASGLISRLADETHQGEILGVSRSFGAMGRVLGPAFGGWAFSTLGPSWPFLLAAGVMALAFLLAVPVLRKAGAELDRQAAETPPS